MTSPVFSLYRDFSKYFPWVIVEYSNRAGEAG